LTGSPDLALTGLVANQFKCGLARTREPRACFEKVGLLPALSFQIKVDEQKMGFRFGKYEFLGIT